MLKMKKWLFLFGAVLLVLASSLITFLILDTVDVLNLNGKNEITITIKNSSKIYDGKPLDDFDYEITEGNLYNGDDVDVHFLGTFVDVGIYEVKADVVIYDKNSKLNTDSYSISVISGEAQITARPLSVSFTDQSVEYSGETIYPSIYSLTSGTLVEGDSFVFEFKNGKADTGVFTMSDSDLSANVYNSVGQNVSKNYNLKYTFGKLTVTKRKITVEPTNTTKEYDGDLNYFDCGKIYITKGTLIEGDEISGEYLITQAPTAINPYGKATLNCTILNDEKEDVTFYYEIENTTYDISITPRSIVVEPTTTSITFTGEKITPGVINLIGGSLASSDKISGEFADSIINVADSKETTLYLKIMNGDIDVTSFYSYNKLTKYNVSIVKKDINLEYTGEESITYSGKKYNLSNKITNDSSGVISEINPISSFELLDVGEYNLTLECLNVTFNSKYIESNYNLIFEPVLITIYKKQITFTHNDIVKVPYTGVNYINNSQLISSIKYTISCDYNGYIDYSVTLEDSTIVGIYKYTITPNLTDIISYNLIGTEGSYEITKKTITVSPQYTSKEYDGNFMTMDCGIITVTSGELISSDYIVGKYVISSYPSYSNLKGKANLFCHIYNDKNEDVTNCYEIENKTFDISITPRSIVVEPTTTSITFTGEKITPGVINLIGGSLVYGDKISGEYSTIITNVNDSSNTTLNIKVLNSNSEDITNLYSYNDYIYYNVNITKKDIHLVYTGEESITYSGNDYSLNGKINNDAQDAISSIDTIYGFTLLNVGEYNLTLDRLNITFNSNYIESNYNLIFEPVLITINKKKITFTHNEVVEVEYTGTNYKTDSELISSIKYTISCDYNGYIDYSINLEDSINVGIYKYTINISLNINNYELIDTEGNYEITPASINFTSTKPTVTKNYTGYPIYLDSSDVTSSNLPTGFTVANLKVQDENNQDVYYVSKGTSVKVYSADIFDSNGNNVTNNYEVTSDFITLKVNTYVIDYNYSITLEYGKEIEIAHTTIAAQISGLLIGNDRFNIINMEGAKDTISYVNEECSFNYEECIYTNGIDVSEAYEINCNYIVSYQKVNITINLPSLEYTYGDYIDILDKLDQNIDGLQYEDSINYNKVNCSAINEKKEAIKTGFFNYSCEYEIHSSYENASNYYNITFIGGDITINKTTLVFTYETLTYVVDLEDCPIVYENNETNTLDNGDKYTVYYQALITYALANQAFVNEEDEEGYIYLEANMIGCIIFNVDGVDVTDCYQIVLTPALLSVTVNREV